MLKRRSLFANCVTAASLAVSIGVSAFSFAAPGDTNSTNNGQVVTGGNYYNTPGNKTTFTNTAGTGLHITAGTTVGGLEVAAPGGALTGNGGHLHFNVPGQTVRLDGVINVSAAKGAGGGFLIPTNATGGRVTIDAAHMFQSGQIFANGVNGGVVNLNVGSLLLTGSARIEATGVDKRPDCFGNGGVINLGKKGAKGTIDVQQGAIVDASGQVVGNYDTTLINVEGGLINIDGILKANGLNIKAPNGDVIDATRGGKISLVANLETESLDSGVLDNASFMDDIKSDVLARDASLINDVGRGWVNIGKSGQLQANGGFGSRGTGAFNGAYIDGTDGGDGGQISIWAQCGIRNDGLITARGGNGLHGRSITGVVNGVNQLAVAGDGGTGGLGGQVYLTYFQSLQNNGLITVKGGKGGEGGNATATIASEAFALGGNGGNGSQGGQIFINGSSEPTGGGGYNVTGGDPGKGGNATTGVLPNQAAVNGVNGVKGENSVVFKTIDPSTVCLDCFGKPDPEGPPEEGPFKSPLGNGDNLVNEKFGLFQGQRPVFRDPQAREIPPLLIALARNNMFFARTYKSVTQEILNLALREFNRQLALGQPDGKARDEAQTLLKRSGVDAEIAASLLDEISQNNLEASQVIQTLLKNIAEEKAVSVNF
jgi:hypothetical protein